MVGMKLRELMECLPAGRRALISAVVGPEGAAEVRIRGGRALDLADEADLTFCKDASRISDVAGSRSQFVVAPRAVREGTPQRATRTWIVTERPRLVLASLLAAFDTLPAMAQQEERIHSDARVSPEAHLAPGVVIGADVEIGRGCVIGANTVIDHAVIGDETRIGPNCSIGGEGFGYEIDPETNEVVKFPHFGRVLIGRHVDILANTAVARGSLRDTIIEDDVRIDNLVHVAHNCVIKRGAFLIANAMIGGSTTVGEMAWVAPSSALMNGITVGNYAMTGLGSVVTKSVAENDLVAGTPAKRLRARFAEGSPILKR